MRAVSEDLLGGGDPVSATKKQQTNGEQQDFRSLMQAEDRKADGDGQTCRACGKKPDVEAISLH